MKTKTLNLLFALVLLFNSSIEAQVTPLFTIGTENAFIDEATNRVFMNDVIVIPELAPYRLNTNVRGWIKDFFNTNTGFVLSQEKDDKQIEVFYKKEFQKRTSPNNEKMGVSVPFLYSNKKIVTYKAIFGHYLNGVTYKVDIATFSRKTGNRLTVKDIFKCDDNTIKKLMFENLPKKMPCDLKTATDIKIISAGINRKSIDVVGTIYKENTATFEIPFEDAVQYLTNEAYEMHGVVIKSKGTIFSDDEPVSWTNMLFRYWLLKESLSYGKYHNEFLDEDFVVQLDKKYDFDKDGELKSKNPRDRIYMEIPSDDDNKEAFMEFTKSSANSFVEELREQLKDYLEWKKKMESQNFSKYKLEDNGGEEANFSYYRKDDNSYGYVEDVEYIYQFTYDNKLRTTAIVIKQKNKSGVDKKRFKLGEDSERTYSLGAREDKLSGWTLILEQPDREIPAICKAIESCIEMMK